MLSMGVSMLLHSSSAISSSATSGPPRETEQTAELDNHQLVMMQRDIMRGTAALRWKN